MEIIIKVGVDIVGQPQYITIFLPQIPRTRYR